MEPKKNPLHDVHRHRSTLFTVGLITSLAIIIMAFKWKSELKILPPQESEPGPYEWVYTPPSTDHVYRVKQEKKPVITPTKFVEVKKQDLDVGAVQIEEPAIENDKPVAVAPIEVPVEPKSEEPFIHVEQMPAPVGGYEAFYKSLRKNLKYPGPAKRTGIQGKVSIEFIVSKTGELSNFKVARGIGGGCDEEAIRVIKLIKWNAGKQRGVPVNVRMIQTIYFALN